MDSAAPLYRLSCGEIFGGQDDARVPVPETSLWPHHRKQLLIDIAAVVLCGSHDPFAIRKHKVRLKMRFKEGYPNGQRRVKINILEVLYPPSSKLRPAPRLTAIVLSLNNDKRIQQRLRDYPDNPLLIFSISFRMAAKTVLIYLFNSFLIEEVLQHRAPVEPLRG
jgi:hypothetical protein